MAMIESTLRNMFSPRAWWRFWDSFEDLEAAMAVTEGEIHDARISRLEVDVALLRAHIVIPTDADIGVMHAAARDGIDRSDRLRRTS